jgi:exopolysaccharide biosynthesis polyprenyl glycosylphosphotransferase
MGHNQKPFWRITFSERQFILLLGDLIVAGIAMLVALYFWAMGDQWLVFSWQFLEERPPDWFFFLPFIWMLFMLELYDGRRASRRADTIRGIGLAVAISTIFYLLIFFIADPGSLPRRGVAVFISLAALLTFGWRMLYIRIFTAPVFLRRVLIIGAGRAGSTIAEIIQKITPPPFRLVGFIDDDPQKIGKKITKLPVLGDSHKLLEIIESQQITDLVFAISGDMQPSLYSAILFAEEKGVEVTTMPKLYEDLLGRVPIAILPDDWLLRTFVDRSHASASYELIKRLMDLIVAIIGVFFLILLFPFISLLIVATDGLPIIYRQQRVGKSGFQFKLLKFRSMFRDAEKDGIPRFAEENDERVTTVGRFLRRSHLDELPQFINVLRGDISMVGPRAERPELAQQLEREVPFYRARLFVKPGVTGWAQINYHYAGNVEETAVKLEYDLYYIMHRHIVLDLMIIFRTLGAIIRFLGR